MRGDGNAYAAIIPHQEGDFSLNTEGNKTTFQHSPPQTEDPAGP